MKKIFTFFAIIMMGIPLAHGQETGKPFITTWTIVSSDLNHSLAMTSGLDYDFSYVWRDASNGVVSSGTHKSADGEFKTAFQAAGTYTLEISGTFPHFNRTSLINIQKLADVKQWGDIAWQSMSVSFLSWPGSAFTATDAPDLTNVTDMSYMFRNSPFNQDISGWNVSSVTNMESMFDGGVLSGENYDAMLVSWSNLPGIKSNVKLGVGTTTFCKSATAREKLITDFGWTISDGGKSCSFITSWGVSQISGSTAVKQVILKLTEGLTYNFDYRWKDAQGATISMGNIVSANLPSRLFVTDFPSPGTYTLEITRNFPHLSMDQDNIDKLIDVKQWGEIQWKSMQASFAGWGGTSFSATDTPDLTFCTTMNTAFINAANFNQDLNDWKVGNVENMLSVFRGATAFNGNISNWDVSKVNTMRELFQDTAFNQDIGGWNVINVTNMGTMFTNSPFNQDISGWNVSKVTNMETMFNSSSFNQDISGWNVSNVTDMRNMFGNSPFNQDISAWNVSKVTNMSNMFYNSPFNQDISGWNVSSVTNMRNMFDSSSFNQDISGWNVGKVTTMQEMFKNTAFNQDISTWKILKVITMENMFLNGHLSGQNYDKMLLEWESLSISTGINNFVKLGVGSTTFCKSQGARLKLINSLGWEITDGGQACSSGTDIVSLSFDTQTGDAIIDSEGHSVSIEVSSAATIASLPLTLILSPGATSSPANGTLIDFTNPVTISVTAEDGTKQDWSIVTKVKVVKPFITTWTIASSDLSHSLTLTSGLDYDFSYVWRDASNAVVSSGTHKSAEGAFNTTFQAAGTYTLEISGTFPHFNRTSTTNIRKLADVKQWGDIAWQSMNASFAGWGGTGFSATDTPDLTNVTDMRFMFLSSSFNQDISNWNVSKVTDMSSMFADSPFNQDISGWDVSNVTDMSFMFYNEDRAGLFNKDISAWNVSKVTNMSGMFDGSAFNQDISAWNVSKVTDMSFMFGGSPFNQDISGWDVGNVATMERMFDNGVLSGENYDTMLVSWSNLPGIKSNVKLGVGTTTFCKSAAARNKLIDTFGWVITDGGKLCSSETAIVSLSFDTQTGDAIINSEDHSVGIEVSSAAAIASLPLTLTLSPGATSSPVSGTLIDFTNPVTISVTAEDGATTQEWTVTVTQGPALGLPQQDQIELTVYPNPFEEVLYIKSEKPFSVSLSNMSGARLHQEKSEGDLQIKLAGLSSGMYLLVIENEDGVSTKKVVKK